MSSESHSRRAFSRLPSVNNFPQRGFRVTLTGQSFAKPSMLTLSSVGQHLNDKDATRSNFSSVPHTCIVLLTLLCSSVGQDSAKLPTLTHIEEIRRLSPEDALKGYPVRVRGVITMDAPAPDFMVQDETAGIYVEGSANPAFRHHLGERIELEGKTGPGKFAPVIRESGLHVLGPGALPTARLRTFSEIADGQQDSQWIKMRGIVRSASVDRTSWKEMALALRVASEGGDLNVRVPITQVQDFSSWIDREILIAQAPFCAVFRLMSARANPASSGIA